ncbi:DegV family protein [Bacillus luteolus]|uniref:DegV family protein n=1 Tax=Litchfieldia luteola TaxID=682179 RepID=A0ABR9QNS9_9BACI|nr:DegV family protein [Cytobacillus luteolus]MBE4910157.1 DegV family protein [Cytobacillus luteolus]MBP1942277.1 DegV family protein with EDD domain [Cytobacillus luteolus]
MERVAWVTDSSVWLDEDIQNRPDVFVEPITIFFEEEEYLDGITITPEQFYTKLRTSQSVPKTSQPPVGKFAQLYNRLHKDFDHIFSIHLSGKLSGTLSSAQQAANLVDIPVTVIDSKILTYPMGVLIREGIRLRDDGKDIKEINSYLTAMANKNETYVLIGSLEQLHRSGRMNSAQFFLGSMLSIKPIISITDGALSVVEKVRSEKKATARIIQLLKDAINNKDIEEIYILFGLNDDKAKGLKEEIKQISSRLKISIFPLGTAIGVHAGEDTLGISWFYK